MAKYTGVQRAGSPGQNAQLNCAVFSLSSPAQITDVKIEGTKGFWINPDRPTVPAWQLPMADFPNAASAIGYVIPAGGPYYLCPNKPDGLQSRVIVTTSP